MISFYQLFAPLFLSINIFFASGNVRLLRMEVVEGKISQTSVVNWLGRDEKDYNTDFCTDAFYPPSFFRRNFYITWYYYP